MYRLGLAPWERRPGASIWQSLTEGPGALPPGRALDVGCVTGRDAVYLATHGWQVTAVDFAAAAIAKARQRAADEGVQVQSITGDVSSLAGLGLEPGHTLVYGEAKLICERAAAPDQNLRFSLIVARDGGITAATRRRGYTAMGSRMIGYGPWKPAR